MAWNEPGNSGDKDPWGNRDGGPPDLDEVMTNLQKKVSSIFGGGDGGAGQENSGGLLFVGMLIAAAIWLATGFYRITEGQEGVVLRFGEFQTISRPGLHWRFPAPVESVEIVDLGKIRAVEIGYRENSRTGQTSSVPFESLMLTADENIIDIKFAIQYQVKNSKDFLFNIRDPEGTLQQVAESAIRQQVGETRMDAILSVSREQVAIAVASTMQQLLDRYQSGIIISSVNMQDAQPPEQVQAAFADAVKAREDKQRLINEAEAYRNDILPRASGEAARMVAEAEAYEVSLTSRATGVASRFDKLRVAYEQAPEVTRKRLYLETMEQVMSVNRKVMIEGDAGNNLLYLPLDKMIKETGGRAATGLSANRVTSQQQVPLTDTRSVRRGREARQ